MTRVGGRYGEAEPPVLIVRVRERAIDGQANEAVRVAIAVAFRVRPSDVTILAGTTGRVKRVLVVGGNVGRLKELLEGSADGG